MLSQLCISLADMLAKPQVITGILLVAIGVALSIMATKITAAVRKTKDIKPDDKLLLILKAVGLVLALVGLIVMVLPI